MTWVRELRERLRRWWADRRLCAPVELAESSEPVARMITPSCPVVTPEQLAHHARRKSRQNAHVATQAAVSGGV